MACGMAITAERAAKLRMAEDTLRERLEQLDKDCCSHTRVILPIPRITWDSASSRSRGGGRSPPQMNLGVQAQQLTKKLFKPRLAKSRQFSAQRVQVLLRHFEYMTALIGLSMLWV